MSTVNQVSMSAVDVLAVKVGRVYEAKKPTAIGVVEPLINDRMVKWISIDGSFVQYDGPAVKFGARYPKVRMENFRNWAGRDVTDEMPAGEWRVAHTRRKGEGA